MQVNNADLWGTLVGILGIVIFICTIIFVISIIAKWKIFRKAGEEGVYSLIPIYNEYIFSKIVFGKGMYFLIEMGGIVLSMIGRLIMRLNQSTTVQYSANKVTTHTQSGVGSGIGLVLVIIGAVIASGYTLVSLYKLAICFNKSTTYAVIMAIAPVFVFCGIGPIVSFVMYLNIAFGSDAIYVGADDEKIEENFEDIENI